MHGTHGMHPECFALDCVSGSAVRLYFGVFPPYFLIFREFCEGYLTGAFSMMRISHAFFLRIYFHFALLPGASCTLLVALPGSFFVCFCMWMRALARCASFCAYVSHLFGVVCDVFIFFSCFGRSCVYVRCVRA